MCDHNLRDPLAIQFAHDVENFVDELWIDHRCFARARLNLATSLSAFPRYFRVYPGSSRFPEGSRFEANQAASDAFDLASVGALIGWSLKTYNTAWQTLHP